MPYENLEDIVKIGETSEDKIRKLLALQDPRLDELLDALERNPGNLTYHLQRLRSAGLLKPSRYPCTWSGSYPVSTNGKPKVNSDKYRKKVE